MDFIYRMDILSLKMEILQRINGKQNYVFNKPRVYSAKAEKYNSAIINYPPFIKLFYIVTLISTNFSITHYVHIVK
jgi:hypothetical protein